MTELSTAGDGARSGDLDGTSQTGMTGAGEILLVSCYEPGYQPLALASVAAFLIKAGYAPSCLDLAVEDLQERLRAGKIYAPEKVSSALENFFKDENLAHLRELALREVAESVERGAAFRRATPDPAGSSDESTSRTRVMVCLSSGSPHAATLILLDGKAVRFASPAAAIATIWR